MYPWEGQTPQQALAIVGERDGRRFRVGYAIQGPEKQHELRWFTNKSELAMFLQRIEPLLQAPIPIGLDLKQKLEACATLIDTYGMAPEILADHNQLTGEHYQMLWMGSLEDLKKGNGPWPAAQRKAFFEQEKIESDDFPNSLTADYLVFLSAKT